MSVTSTTTTSMTSVTSTTSLTSVTMSFGIEKFAYPICLLVWFPLRFASLYHQAWELQPILFLCMYFVTSFLIFQFIFLCSIFTLNVSCPVLTSLLGQVADAYNVAVSIATFTGPGTELGWSARHVASLLPTDLDRLSRSLLAAAWQLIYDANQRALKSDVAKKGWHSKAAMQGSHVNFCDYVQWFQWLFVASATEKLFDACYMAAQWLRHFGPRLEFTIIRACRPSTFEFTTLLSFGPHLCWCLHG